MAIKIPQEYLTSDFDFGFTAVDEGEVVDPIITDVEASASEDLGLTFNDSQIQPIESFTWQ